VNCGAIPDGTIDSELFGHEKGSFTGAHDMRKGYFEEAHKGTVFLDEVAELPLTTQVRLLRVLESGEFLKVGSSKVQKTDVRVVAATNVNVMQAVQSGRFREDLYYRLNTVPIHIPALREREEDIYLLFRKFAADFAERYRMPAVALAGEAQQVLLAYYWPGNVRQLKNVVEQLSVIENSRTITAETLRRYLPEQEITKLPILYQGKPAATDFASEREILYKILFDMRQDINDLKRVMHGAITHAAPTVQGRTAVPDNYIIPAQESYAPPGKIVPEEVEETLSIQEKEEELIRKALERHSGKRKLAAQDLGISERTLYRKIKEYQLEN
ncbi:MAG: sigma-54 dependent transcriptional regulator, partial [Prevotellaceae bacterium]|jgi:DNA-binding NtrC family response regulator|nr:sigma-54 dependent transcriptional regulator [Prevotellaceae bacterium]